MDTLEISLRTEQGIYTETYNPPQNFLGHFTFSVKKHTFPFLLQQFPSSSNKTNSTAPPPPLSEQCCMAQSLQTQPTSNNGKGVVWVGKGR